MSVRAGCADLLRATKRVMPVLHMFGHIHTDGGVFPKGATTYANVTTWECERGATVMDLDISNRKLTLVTVPDRDPRNS